MQKVIITLSSMSVITSMNHHWPTHSEAILPPAIASKPTMDIKTTQSEEIDRQHAGLVKALDELMAYAGGHYDFSASLTALGSLLEYTQAHFSYEEQLMREWGYPHLKEHLAQHAGFTAQVEALWKSAEAGEVMSGEIISMVRDWIIRHINEEDVQYATVARRPDGLRGGVELPVKLTQ